MCLVTKFVLRINLVLFSNSSSSFSGQGGTEDGRVEACDCGWRSSDCLGPDQAKFSKSPVGSVHVVREEFKFIKGAPYLLCFLVGSKHTTSVNQVTKKTKNL